MAVFNLVKFFKILNYDRVSYLSSSGFPKKHWVYNGKREPLFIVRDLYESLGYPNIYLSRYSLQKKDTCTVKGCVNPDCYQLAVANIKDEFYRQEILELATELDLDSYFRLGEEEYLKAFNREQPDFLKTNIDKLRDAIDYLKGTSNLW